MKKKTLGEFLKTKRLEQGLYQKDFADLLGISRIHYIKLEHDEFFPRLNVIRKIAFITKTPISTIVAMKGTK